MPQSEQIEQEKTPVETPTEAANEKTVSIKKSLASAPKLAGIWWLVFAVLVFFAILGIIATGLAMQRTFSNHDDSFMGRGMMRQDFDSGVRFGRVGGGMMGRGDFDDLSSDTVRVKGVVTAVDDTTITVAGNGTTTKIIINDNTTFSGDDKPAVINDSILAVGTKDGDTFTATRVVLQRQ